MRLLALALFIFLQNPSPPAHYVSLAWTASTSPNIASYNIYRSQDGGQTFAQISTPGAVTGTAYEDDSVDSSLTYVYQVTAVDSAGNESIPSAGAFATWASGRTLSGILLSNGIK